MRPILVALILGAVAMSARASEPRFFEDCTLRTVHFINENEGWAAGDDGVVWHTLNGGGVWERQKTGVRASLRSIQFLNFDNGWIAGREELPGNAGSVGVLLYTEDGGAKWQRLHAGNMPGLHTIKFVDPLHGFVVGDSTEQDPTGVYQTTDGGHSWKPLPGVRSTGWLAADFRDATSGVLAGAWNNIALVSESSVRGTSIDKIDKLGGRNLHAVQLTGEKGEDGVAVGEGGLVLFSDGAFGREWKWPKLDLPPDVLANLDFHAVSCVDKHVWIVGRPGSVVLHSPDRGGTWELLRTGQTLPLHSIQFVSDKLGFAVGELGTVLSTKDGGKTWQLSRRGGQRCAGLFIHARASGLPVDALATLGAEEGYLIAALRVASPDSSSSGLVRASDPQRFAAAVRLAGGAAGEMLWQFPVPQHQSRVDRAELMKAWDRLHADQAGEQMLRQLVLAMRMWQPDVIVTDPPDDKSSTVVEGVVSEAAREAYERAVDPKSFPEQITRLGLVPCKAGKLYATWPQAKTAQVVLDVDEPGRHLEASARHFAAVPRSLLGESPLPAERCFRLLAASAKGAELHKNLFQDVVLAQGGPARRKLEDPGPLPDELKRALADQRSLERIIETPIAELSDPNKLLAQLGTALEALPERLAAPAIGAIAHHYVRMGQWTLAHEAFLLMISRYPGHPEAAEAYRWLIRYSSSGEARHRHELGQFMVIDHETVKPPAGSGSGSGESTLKLDSKTKPQMIGGMQKEGAYMPLVNPDELRQWHQSALSLESRLAAFGRVQACDPGLQFCLNSSRRALGDFDGPRKWCTQFVANHPEGPWREAALAELWLTHHQGPPPRPLLMCPLLDEKPFLDGQLDDACWQNVKPVTLKNAVGETQKEYPTQAWLAYDKDFLYLAVRCEHPEGHYVEPVKPRPRDADVRPYDRITLMLDLDRDYTTTFNLHVDQRGCVCDDCWGDVTWNPHWFVACNSEKTYWQIEAAIPLLELTSSQISSSSAWACNVVRILPGRGVQAFSTPADVLPRPEGMGLLMFGPTGK